MKYPNFDGTQACADADTNIFFSLDPDDPEFRPANFREAKRICSGCSWKNQCLEWAVSEPGLLGVWGGTSERERSRLRGSRVVA